MTRPLLVLICCFAPAFATLSVAEQPAIQFDVPSLLPVRELVEAGPSLEATQKLVEIVIPVSSRIHAGDRMEVEEFQFECYWNRNVYPLVDFGPHTATGSSIDGLVEIEQRKDRTGNFGINLNARFNELVGGTAQAGIQDQSGTTVRYREFPEHEAVIASGSIHRGTGAYFRFRPAPTTTLEGCRDLLLVFQVPLDWRGGLVQVDCQARGRKRLFAGFSEPVAQERSFVIAVYLAGDEEARRLATEYVRSEQSLRTSWYQEVVSQPRTARQLGNRDVDLLVQSSTNEELASLHRALPHKVARESKRYLAAKRELVELGKTAQPR